MGRLSGEAKALSAREQARVRAAAYRDRERKLEELGVEYFTADEQIAKVDAARDREIAAAREKARRAAAAAIASADAVIRQMVGLGVSRAEVIDRLGCTAADVRRATTEPGDPDDAAAEPNVTGAIADSAAIEAVVVDGHAHEQLTADGEAA